MMITDEQHAAIQRITIHHDLELVVLYGSKAHGRTRTGSDLDIAVLARRLPDTTLFHSLFREISDIFTGENVDLRFLNDADPLFAMQVVKSGMLLAGNRDRYNDFKTLTNRRYIDDGMKYFPALDEHLHAQQEYLERVIQ